MQGSGLLVEGSQVAGVWPLGYAYLVDGIHAHVLLSGKHEVLQPAVASLELSHSRCPLTLCDKPKVIHRKV